MHTFSGVPMEESLSTEHRRELLGNPLEELLYSGRISNKCSGHFQASWSDVAYSCLHIIWDPFHKVR